MPMYRYRTHTCGELRKEHTGSEVKLAGWIHTRRDHKGVLFIDLRDRYGITQVVVPSDSPLHEAANDFSRETVLSVSGRVVNRAESAVNPNMETGEVEVVADALELLSSAKPLPFSVADDEDVAENRRLTYRFLDLRRRKMVKNIVLRSNVIADIRRRMIGEGFTEIQTPILTSSSPEGARDFLVPSRLHPGKFYALPQAPQQFKQLLMVAGLDRYFQIAPCFRDEDARADRSPGEFYQLDLEMSFVEQEDVFEVVERVLHGVFKEFTDWEVTAPPFPRITFLEAMERYGSDKPDLRYGLPIYDVTDLAAQSEARLFTGAIEEGSKIKALCVPGVADRPRSFFDGLDRFLREQGGKGLPYLLLAGDQRKGSLASSLEPAVLEKMCERMGAEDGSGLFFFVGPNIPTLKLAGKLRVRFAELLGLAPEGVYKFCWIVDFPMYEFNEEHGAIEFSHNPFSMPQGGMEALLTKDPLDILAYQYDIVCNGIELSSGAIRNHSPEIMYKAFEIAGYSQAEVDDKFAGMIRAFEYGAPPHGGIAPGIDRIVMLLAREANIREIIAFPMNQNAQDLLMNAPNEVDAKQLEELHIALKLPTAKLE